MQEQINDKSVSLVIRGTKLTGRILQQAMAKLLRDMQKPKQAKLYRGKQTVKRLVRQGAGVSNAELSDSGIKKFDRAARKYGVDYALQKDADSDPPRWVVFFKARDEASIMAAIKDHLSKTVTKGEKKPSLLESLCKNLEIVSNKVRDRVKNKDRGREL